MQRMFDALAFHLPSHPLEAVALLLAVAVAAAAWTRIGGAPTGLLASAGTLGSFIQIGHPAIPLAIAAVGLLHLHAGRTIPPGRFAREVAIVLAGYLAYEAGRFAVVSEPAPAIRNAERIVDLERALGLFRERDIQQLLTGPSPIVDAWNLLYSHAFLAVVIGALLWLVVADPPRYRLYRNALGASAALALLLIALFPVAPPRLIPALGIDDTVISAGNPHHFANEYAAIPSLHVGWIALTGWMLALPLRGWPRRLVMVGPGLGMLLVVIVTGNHYWFDGLVGAVVSIGPAVASQHSTSLLRFARELAAAARSLPSIARRDPRGRFSALSLGGLFIYLGLARVVNPGFTDFWGYLFFQVGATLLLLLLAEGLFAGDGGLSWLTHGIAVICTWADVLGTDGDLYARIDEYDKLTHFMGTAAFTAAAWEILRAVALRTRSTRPPRDRFFLAVAIGIAAGIGWEVYEYLGDVVFQTTRTQGRWDTFNDLVSDSAGAIAIAALLWWQERRVALALQSGPVPPRP